jgi:hypothetical protein
MAQFGHSGSGIADHAKTAGPGEEQLANLPPSFEVETLGADFDTGTDAFVDTAAAMACLDLVVT